MLPAFGPLLAKSLIKSGISQKNFAMRVGLTQPYISLLVAGKRAIPYKGVEEWPGILGLSPAEAQEFLLAADLTRTPKRVLDWIGKQGLPRQV